jgi:tRNA pseudouridine38-40 synthase
LLALHTPGPAGSHRLRLDLAYDGTDFSGWARQPGRRTVQQVVEDALARVLRLAAVATTVAGRTDAGVHATGQVAHADLPPDIQADGLVRRLAGVLAPDVRVTALTVAPSGFDARFSAIWRRYEYLISDLDSGADPLRRRFVLDHRRRLDVTAMNDAATRLVGLHDFAAFCRRREGATTVRTLLDCAVRRFSDDVLVTVRADAFCHSMVRSLVGALIAVGEGRRCSDWPASLLASTERSSAVTVAPPHGLTLVEVGYPPDDELAARAQLTRARRHTPIDTDCAQARFS